MFRQAIGQRFTVSKCIWLQDFISAAEYNNSYNVLNIVY